MGKLLAVACSVTALCGFSASTVFAEANPAGTGQPGTAKVENGGAECGATGSEAMPKGFETPAFEAATTVYAGAKGTPSAIHGSPTHAISQYDIACFQQTQNHK